MGAVLYSAAVPPLATATASVSSTSTSSCWRHSRRNSRHAQRTTARRAATPPLRSHPRPWPAPLPVPPADGRPSSAGVEPAGEDPEATVTAERPA